MSTEITPDMVLEAYAAGIFPMAETADDPSLFWVEPKQRGVIPLEDFHIPKKLAKVVRSDQFTVLADHDFEGVINGCAAPAEGRDNTWINAEIRRLYGALFKQNHCHTIEVYAEGKLVGGLYGLHIGSAFFGESMFHTKTDASKVALVHLVARLRAGGFTLLDTQFITAHLRQFGAIEIPRAQYLKKLSQALDTQSRFDIWPRGEAVTGAKALTAFSIA